MFTFWGDFYAWLVTGVSTWFLFYYASVWLIALPRMFLGTLYHYQHKRRLINRWPKRRYKVSAVVTAMRRQSQAELYLCIWSLYRSLKHGAEEFEIIICIDAVKPGDAVWHNRLFRLVGFGVRIIYTDNRSKRHNLRDLIQRVNKSSEILVLVDGDTFAEIDTIYELCLPFGDKKIGGSTTAQGIYHPKTVLQRLLHWMENARRLSSMAMTSKFKSVPCMPGRMYAVRAKLMTPEAIDAFVNETFFGKLCGPGDDRYITQKIVLKQGYGSVMNPNARITTNDDDGWKKAARRQLRWGQTSQRYTVFGKELFRYPVAAWLMVSDIYMSFATTFTVLIYWPYSWLYGTDTIVWWEIVLYLFAGVTLSMGARQWQHLKENPADILLLPIFVVVATVLQIIRVVAFFTLFNVNTWGTEKDADEKGERTGVNFDTGPCDMQKGNFAT